MTGELWGVWRLIHRCEGRIDIRAEWIADIGSYQPRSDHSQTSEESPGCVRAELLVKPHQQPPAFVQPGKRAFHNITSSVCNCMSDAPPRGDAIHIAELTHQRPIRSTIVPFVRIQSRSTWCRRGETRLQCHLYRLLI